MQTTENQAAQLFGYDVIDGEGNKVGSVDNVWVDDATNELEFIGVKTGWLMGKTHVIPVSDAQIGNDSITVSFPQDTIKDAPSFGGDHELSSEEEDQIYSHYGVQRSTAPSPSGLPAGGTTEGFSDTNTGTTSSYGGTDTGMAATGEGDQAGMTLSEEQLRVGKREVQAGSVRLRKIVNTEHQEVPVELRREEVQIERIDASDASVPSDAFREQEVEVPVMREEAVVGKEARVTGGVALNKNVQTETETVGGDVRKEDVDIERPTGLAEGETSGGSRRY
jgi:uncharacterized protein (TIGR02271 family)